MRIFLYLVLLIVILLGISFAYLNAEPVVFNYYLAQRHIPLSLLLVCSLGIGLILGFLVVGVSWLKLKGENFRLKKRLKCTRQEIENLRAIPIQDKH